MIKTIKEILVSLDNKMHVAPAGTYLINRGFDKYYFLLEDLKDTYLETRHIENMPGFFIEVVSDEPEVYGLIRKFSDLLDRQDIDDILNSIDLTDNETVKRIRNFFGGGESAIELRIKIKDLETQLFLEKAKKTGGEIYPSRPGHVAPYVGAFVCQVCGIDMTKNTNYVCGNSACPSRTIWFSTTSDTANSLPPYTNVSNTTKKEEEE